MILPEKLKKGDIVKVITPASPADKEKVYKGKEIIEQWGLKVELGESCFYRNGYLAGDDSERVSDINEAFADKRIKGIICSRGGYGTLRLLDKIDYKNIRENPKVFVGFSDITAMHIAINQKSKLITYHGPMVASNMFDIEDETKNSFIDNVIMTCNKKIEYINNLKILCSGNATGILTGGNLSLIVSTLGTDFEIDTKGKVLFIEDVGEEVYRIDRMLTQLRLAGKLRDAAAIILGDFKDCGEVQELTNIFSEFFCRLKKPVLYNLKSGHCKPIITIPLGMQVKIVNSRLIY
ncbi:S66 peptidase family protein [Clostridium sp. DL1XJH146]